MDRPMEQGDERAISSSVATMVIIFAKQQGKPNPQNGENPRKAAFSHIRPSTRRRAFTTDSSRCLNCPSNLIGHDHPDKPANGVCKGRLSAARPLGRALG
jgi:hypothetical protein